MASRLLSLLLGLVMAFAAVAKDAAPAAADPVLEDRMMVLASELRCLVCQNETIAGSHAGLAVDLRQQIREMLQNGQNEDQIRQYMTDRYGDFVLYKPPFKATTAVLWAGPAVLMLLAMVSLVVVLRRRQRASPDEFDSELPDDAQAADSPDIHR